MNIENKPLSKYCSYAGFTLRNFVSISLKLDGTLITRGPVSINLLQLHKIITTLDLSFAADIYY